MKAQFQKAVPMIVEQITGEITEENVDECYEKLEQIGNLIFDFLDKVDAETNPKQLTA